MRSQDLPHVKGGDAEEMHSIFIVGMIFPNQLKVDFIDQGGGLQSMIRPFLP